MSLAQELEEHPPYCKCGELAVWVHVTVVALGGNREYTLKARASCDATSCAEAALADLKASCEGADAMRPIEQLPVADLPAWNDRMTAEIRANAEKHGVALGDLEQTVTRNDED